VPNRDFNSRPPRPPHFSGSGGPRRPDGPRDGGRGGHGGSGGRPGGPRDFGRPGPRDDRREPRKPAGKPPEIIHRDRDLIVVVKNPGQPTKGKPGASVVSLINEHLASRSERYRPVHELDEVASGTIALVPVTEDDDLREIRSSATYLALVEGDFDTGADPERVITGPVPGLKTKSSSPVTSVRRIASANGLTLLRVRARPDAPGQIRAHLASAGHPVVGDTEHGSRRDDVRRVGLHAEELRLRHPGTGTTERYRCPAPASFHRAVNAEPPAGGREENVPQPSNLGWDQVAGWYDDLITSGSSDHHEKTVLPGVERLLNLQPRERLLDVACGQGVLLDQLSRVPDHGPLVGVDASPTLIEAGARVLGDEATLIVGDARHLPEVMAEHQLEPFDAAACVLALMNIDDLDSVCRGIAASLRPGGRFVGVILHPAFRSPQTTAWGWTTDGRTGAPVQFRRVDRYMTERASEIVMNPGKTAAGQKSVTTTTHHRPIGAYITALGAAGLPVDTMEEWSSLRSSEPGPRAMAENIARAEIPMFLALRARKQG
jgi:23S rRNA-/tRNA-specific pseudouridylate synthase/SAM-dependent methyltransferase